MNKFRIEAAEERLVTAQRRFDEKPTVKRFMAVEQAKNDISVEKCLEYQMGLRKKMLQNKGRWIE